MPHSLVNQQRLQSKFQHGAGHPLGGTGGDIFWMGSPEGADTISDFDYSAGDRIQLSSGITWSVADVNSVAVVTFSTGATVTLTGVTSSSVVDGWFTTG